MGRPQLRVLAFGWSDGTPATGLVGTECLEMNFMIVSKSNRERVHMFCTDRNEGIPDLCTTA